MSDYGERIGADAVRFRRRLPGPVERVWQHLTDAELRRRWLCGGETETTVGGRVELIFRNADLSPLPDIEPPEKYRDLPAEMCFHGVVTRWEPPTVLAHTWVGDDEHSEVTYELTPDGDDVLLTLTHRRVTTREMMESVLGGWHTHLDILLDVLHEREPQPFWLRHTALELDYQSRLNT